jgi:hypothetical protein
MALVAQGSCLIISTFYMILEATKLKKMEATK